MTEVVTVSMQFCASTYVIDVDDRCWHNLKTVVLVSTRMTDVDDRCCDSVKGTVVLM